MSIQNSTLSQNRMESFNAILECYKKKIVFQDVNKLGHGSFGVVYSAQAKDVKYTIARKHMKEEKDKKGSFLEFMKEAYTYSCLSNAVQANIIPHFLLCYSSQSRSIMDKFIDLELADGSANSIFTKTKYSDNFYMSFLFQSIVGILMMQDITDCIHSDFLPRNILFKSLKHPEVYEYIFDTCTYKVDIYNMYFVSDFGHVQSIKESRDDKILFPPSWVNHEKIMKVPSARTFTVAQRNFILENSPILDRKEIGSMLDVLTLLISVNASFYRGYTTLYKNTIAWVENFITSIFKLWMVGGNFFNGTATCWAEVHKHFSIKNLNKFNLKLYTSNNHVTNQYCIDDFRQAMHKDSK